MDTPKGYRRERGLLWPAYDEKCAAVVFKMSSDLDVILRMIGKRRTVVQAGGNCGVWPRALAPKFEQVYTFEPDPTNFFALRENVAEFANVHPFNVALGAEAGHVEMFTPAHETDNCGALQIDVKTMGTIPMITIDSLGLPAVDLIYLDIEGFEIPALQGAAETIKRCKPLVALEDKGLSQRYGFEQGDVVEIMNRMGYGVAQRIHRDIVFAPRCHCVGRSGLCETCPDR